jgi:hypothetical protein
MIYLMTLVETFIRVDLPVTKSGCLAVLVRSRWLIERKLIEDEGLDMENRLSYNRSKSKTRTQSSSSAH